MSTAGPTGQARLKRVAERGGRRAGVRAAVFLGLAVVAAGATAIFFTRYLEARTAAVRVPTVKVVVAATDIPMATPLREEVLRVVDWPAASRPERAPSEPRQVAGRVALTTLLKGEPILEPKLASTTAGSGLAALLPDGMRAVAVRVDDVVGVAGFIHPGDQVDVIVTMKPSDTSGVPPVSKIILQRIRVLAVGKDLADTGSGREKAVAATVATLMVDSEESEKLALAATKGSILLALRNRVDVEEVATPGMVPPTLLAGAPSGEKPRPPPPPAARPALRPSHRTAVAEAKPPAPAPAPADRNVVEILRGDLFEKRDFDKGASR
jgi:pilus assembly protein CpaB